MSIFQKYRYIDVDIDVSPNTTIREQKKCQIPANDTLIFCLTDKWYASIFAEKEINDPKKLSRKLKLSTEPKKGENHRVKILENFLDL